MAKKAEEIVAKLRQAKVMTRRGKPVAEAIRSIGVLPVRFQHFAFFAARYAK